MFSGISNAKMRVKEQVDRIHTELFFISKITSKTNSKANPSYHLIV